MGQEPQTERRRHPRYAFRIPVKVAGMEAHTTNLSTGGMQVACPMLQAELIRPELQRGRVTLTVSGVDGKPLNARAEIRYLSEYGQDLLLGLVIEGFDEGGRERYRELVSGIASRAPQV